MSGNSFPEFDGGDGGMRRGLLVVEWPVTIPGSEQRDFDVVVGEFMRDASGILNLVDRRRAGLSKKRPGGVRRDARDD